MLLTAISLLDFGCSSSVLKGIRTMLRQDMETTVPVMTVVERAVIYARVSGDDRSKDGRNLDGFLRIWKELER